VADVQRALRALPAEDRRAALARARLLRQYADLVEEASRGLDKRS
jgi:hypothetical protein